ncbi:pentapeptide repeat-containing protein [Trueperella pyogenes]|uniref:pentapeptide repeat-containing protein n=1 Tax=Trueperella pyogenes TaxID=1661 RepID=UPI0024C01CB9|nr:pentapeptide repeat-containing protein [Trueperella pyogenes]WHU57079.1 pentapeptide repeat-containing protein [Trueperella pyogenes]
MMTNAEKIQEWRNTHPAERITAEILRGVLNLDTLWDANLWDADLQDANLWRADLRGANLWRADLRGANLQDANLWRADLWGANLQDANLWRADLRGANLRGANLWDADLRGANLQNNTSGSILQIFGLYPYPAVLTPTPEGWQLRVGCWTGTVAGLRYLAALDDGWPEARGEEILRRRPLLYAIADICNTHIANHQGLIDWLAEKWGNRK